MADPVKEQIAEHIASDLADINTGNGYYTNIKRVSRRREDIRTDGLRLPAVYLFSGTEDPPQESLGAGCYRSAAEMVVTGYVEGGDELDSLVVKMERDIIVSVMTDRSQGGLAERTMLLGSTTDYSEFAPWGRGLVTVSFDVVYKWSLSAP